MAVSVTTHAAGVAGGRLSSGMTYDMSSPESTSAIHPKDGLGDDTFADHPQHMRLVLRSQ